MVSDKSMPMVTIPSHLAYVNCLRAFLVAFCKAHGLNDCTTEALALAVHEAVTNVIRHGHGYCQDKTILFGCAAFPDRVEIHILDEGTPFDITQVPDMDPGEIRIGGRGVFLMRTLLDQIRCEPRPGGGNHFRLVKFCSPRLPSAAMH